MISDKMIRFLKSIGIENTDAFDMDFDVVKRNEVIREQVDMQITKKTPWSEITITEFMGGLRLIGYPVQIIFSYIVEPSVYDAINIFNAWYRMTYMSPSPFEIEPSKHDTRTINLIAKNEDLELAKSVRLDYIDFLHFIFYRFEIEISEKKEEVKAPEVSQKEMDKMVKEATEVFIKNEEESKNEETETYYKSVKEVEDDSLANEVYETSNDKVLKANEKKMIKEREKYSRDSWKDKLPLTVIENIGDINERSGRIDVIGETFGIEKIRTLRNGATMLTFGIGKGDEAIAVKAIENENITKTFLETLVNGLNIRIIGLAGIDSYTHQLTISARQIDVLPPPPLREDPYPEKRVELHLHTKMSNMDGVGDVKKYFKLAKNMGHKAIAVTDHGVTQAFPEAQKYAEEVGIKAIYGSELYMVNDELPFALNPKDIQLTTAKYVIFDLETTGLSRHYDRITEFGAVLFEHGSVVKTIDLFINPERPIPEAIQEKTKITEDMVKNAPTIEEAIDQILAFFGDAILVSHNILFDVGFINEALKRMGRPVLSNPGIDTLSLSRYMFPESSLHKLGSLSRNLGITSYNDDEAHRADYDARILNEVWQAMLARITAKNYEMKHSDLAKLKTTESMLIHLRPSHVTVLAKNKAGLHNLYELVSLSHVNYFANVPKTPKREIIRLRENLIIGSSCFNGEIFDLARSASKDELVEAMKFYDFIEIQPVPNYSHLIHTGALEDNEAVIRLLKDLVEAAEIANKPVVVTGDVHYADPEDKVIRDIYISAKAVGGRRHPLYFSHGASSPDQHYRSTQEMMDIFIPIFGEEKAREMVIVNPNLIADMTEDFKPVQKDLHSPTIEGAPEMLSKTCYETARRLYGDKLPSLIEERLMKELDGIISNGYAVTYHIAHQIVDRAHSEGYMVGSRGSVGSSLAATMYGITEVNPLPPHYRCPKCKHFELNQNPEYQSGYDLPDKYCPECGAKMVGDGQNIPFQTFLGFNAEKIPDIDLNFPSDYQHRAFDLTKEFFGEENVFRAGTIGKVEEKTAYGYVRNYFEEKQGTTDIHVNPQLISYLASKATDVKRTTGQHAGGVMVLPKGLSIYDFTPIQYPADDKESTWLTTHFDYRALHDALLKLDLLGHVDPLALKMMSEISGVDVLSIPLNDKKVISLFTSDKALERKHNYLNVKTGASGFPEFGTETCHDILITAKPKTFSELVIVAGLAHGTDVWSNNARDLIVNGTATINDVIGCRDDIMTYLIDKGLPNDISFSIMEDVRKGKGKFKANEDKYLPIMRAHGVPEWYIDSCYKIKYMFPKAHAVAYTTMAVRVGYFKLYYPLEFYAVWFTVRAKAYDIEAMIGGYSAILTRYEQLKAKSNSKTEKLSPKESDIQKMLTVAIEMEERGYTFSNIDLYKSDATRFIVDHEKKCLIPPFIVIDNLGEAAANTVIEARKDGKFTSQEDLLNRTKLSQTNVKSLVDIGALKGLGESDQMSLFEFGLEIDD